MESNFSDGDSKCSNLTTEKKKKKKMLQMFRHPQYVCVINTVIRPYFHQPFMNLFKSQPVFIYLFLILFSLNLSSAVCPFITKPTTRWSKYILPHVSYPLIILAVRTQSDASLCGPDRGQRRGFSVQKILLVS